MTSRRRDCPSHPVQAFRVDPGWYARHWLEDTPPRPPGLAARLLARAIAGVGTALRSLHRLGTHRVVHAGRREARLALR